VSSAKIKILDNSTSPFKMPSDGFSLFGRSKVNLENEVEVIKSQRLLGNVVNDLNLTTIYSAIGYVTESEFWNDNPYSIEWLLPKDSLKTKTISFSISLKGNDGFVINESNDKSLKKFNEAFIVYGIPCKIIPSKKVMFVKKNNGLRFTLIKFEDATDQLSGDLQTENVGKQSEILKIILTGNNPKKTNQILDNIVYQFDKDGIADRQLVSERTRDFVNERFVYLSQELDSIENHKETYKRLNKLSFIEADANAASSTKLNVESEAFQLETQVELAKLLGRTLNKDKKYSMLPMNLGLVNSGINTLAAEYNSILLEREKMLLSAGEKNPVVKEFSNKIEELRRNILVSISIYQQELALSLRKINSLKDESTKFFESIPLKEKILRAIDRQQKIKENLFVLLLQKREEALINLAITSHSIKIIDYAISDQTPIFPKKNMVYVFSLLVGLFIPFAIIYIILLFDTKIHSKFNLEESGSDIPLLAEIPHIDNENRVIASNDRSVLAESFRILRTNVGYLLPINTLVKCPIIYTTSSIKGEGKTFISLNTALSFAALNKKVLLIGADLRNPQLHKYLNIKKEVSGLSNYLFDTTTDWKTLISKNILENENLSIILSGSVPPNPAELLSNGRFEELLDILKMEYDYIIVDTAPTILVTDTLLISKLADLTIYVTRADYTDKFLLKFSKDLKIQGKMKNMAYVLNDVSLTKSYDYGYQYSYGYNYGYGYGYNEDNEVQKKKKSSPLNRKLNNLFKL
jgi:capsular exopolysaccharide synthesis family protein